MLHTILARTITGISNSVDEINRGGCGHYAYELAQALALLDIDSQIVLVNHHYDEANVDEFISDIEGAHDLNSAYRIRFANGDINGRYSNPCFGHICLNVDGILYDSEGINTCRAISEAIEPDAMALALSADCWNKSFMYANDGGVDSMKAYISKALAPLMSLSHSEAA